MHPNLDELLALRDGDGDVEGSRHVRFCGQCGEELAELSTAAAALRALPAIVAAEDQWPRIQDRVLRRRKRSLILRVAAAAACGVAALVAVMVVRPVPPDEAIPADRDAYAPLAVEHLTNASKELELVLHRPSLRTQVLSPTRAAIIVDIEDRIALVDLALAESTGDPPDETAVVLWSDRVELLDALVSVRGGPPRSDGIVYANQVSEGSIR